MAGILSVSLSESTEIIHRKFIRMSGDLDGCDLLAVFLKPSFVVMMLKRASLDVSHPSVLL